MWPRNALTCANGKDQEGNPTGGNVQGVGIDIVWQDGPLGRPPESPNGAFVDDVIFAALQRLRFYQDASEGRFRCRENALAITKLEEALMWLQARRAEREQRGVQGTHQP